MPAEITTGFFCVDYWSSFEVLSSKGDQFYTVTFSGASGNPHCSCPAFKHSPDRNCKHIEFVFKNGCFYNEQWYDGGTRRVRPTIVHETHVVEGQQCPTCNGPVVAVQIAV